MEFSHIDKKGNAHMVDVSNKEKTERMAVASGLILMSDECKRLIEEGKHKKGDVLTVAQVAGVMAAKNTSNVIPMTHPISLTHVKVEFESVSGGYLCKSIVKCSGETGVEMEALNSVSTALLTVYDMAKAVDKRMIIKDVHLVEKHGGKSGDFSF